MTAPVVRDRVTGQLNGFTPDNFIFPDYEAGDLMLIFAIEGEGDLFVAQQEDIGLWNMFRARETSVSLLVIAKFMDGTEGASLNTIPNVSGGNEPPKTYIAVSIIGADPYRGLAKITSIPSDDWNADWTTSTSCDPAALTHPFASGEELLWFVLGGADAGVAGSEAGMTGGPSPVDFSHTDYYLPTGITPAQPRAANLGYVEWTSDDASWDPGAWTLPLSEDNAALTAALPPARSHRHPDLIKTEYFKTGTMGTPQTVSLTVPAHTNGLLTIFVCAGAGSTLVLDPGGLAIVPDLGPSEPGAAGETQGAQMFYCAAPAAGTYDLELTKVGTSNNARLVVVNTFNNVDDVIGWDSVESNAASHTVTLSTEDDHVAIAAFSSTAGGSGLNGLPCDNFDVEIDGVPMVPTASAMTQVADAPSGGTTNAQCRTFVGRTSGGSQNFVGYHLGLTSLTRRLLVMYLKGRRRNVWPPHIGAP